MRGVRYIALSFFYIFLVPRARKMCDFSPTHACTAKILLLLTLKHFGLEIASAVETCRGDIKALWAFLTSF